MASRRAYIRDERRSIGGGSSSSDEEDPDEQRQNYNEDQFVVRLPTLRSMIVRVNSDEVEDDKQGDDGRESSLLPPPRVGEEQRKKVTYNSSHANHSRRSEENRRRADGGDNFGPAMPQRDSRVRNGSVTEVDYARDNYRSRERERRDRETGLSKNADKDEEQRAVAAGSRLRGSGRDRDRDRGAVQRRVSPSWSPPRRHHHHKDVDEGKGLRRDGKRREIGRSPDDGRFDDTNFEKFENDAKGKAKQRDGFPREREELGSRDRMRHEEHHSRRVREASPPSSGDTRDPDGRIRSPVAMGRGNMVSKNGADWGKERERDDFRNGKGGRRDMDRERGGGRGDEGREMPVVELYSIHRATVHSIRPFGIFVRMDGYRNHGLVHLGQISHHEVTNRKDSDEQKVEAISSVVGEGEQVWVKVISVQHEEDGKVKVGCSLKLVSQGDGKDLDPNNLQLEKNQSKGPWQPPKKLELEAVYNVSCTRCGGHGHLKKDCYSTGEKTYNLLEDPGSEDDVPGVSNAAHVTSVVPKNLTPAVGTSSKPPSGPGGRGRAMVQPAWMTHGIGVGGDQEKVLGAHSTKARSDLPEKVTSVEDALAVLEMAKDDKHKRRSERRHRKHRKRDRKHSSREGHKEKHKKRHRGDDDHHRKSKKKRRL